MRAQELTFHCTQTNVLIAIRAAQISDIHYFVSQYALLHSSLQVEATAARHATYAAAEYGLIPPLSVTAHVEPAVAEQVI